MPFPTLAVPTRLVPGVLSFGLLLRLRRCAGRARLWDGVVRRRGAGREKDEKTDNADGCPQGLRKGRTHRTVEQALTPDNATIGKGTIFTSAAAASQRLKMAESLRVDRKSLGHPRRPSPCHQIGRAHV